MMTYMSNYMREYTAPPAVIPKHEPRKRMPVLAARKNISLTPMQLKIIGCLIHDGATNKEIANRVGSTEATVKIHFKSITSRTGLGNRTQIALWAKEFLHPVTAPDGVSDLIDQLDEATKSLEMARQSVERVMARLEVS